MRPVEKSYHRVIELRLLRAVVSHCVGSREQLPQLRAKASVLPQLPDLSTDNFLCICIKSYRYDLTSLVVKQLSQVTTDVQSLHQDLCPCSNSI